MTQLLLPGFLKPHARFTSRDMQRGTSIVLWHLLSSACWFREDCSPGNRPPIKDGRKTTHTSKMAIHNQTIANSKSPNNLIPIRTSHIHDKVMVQL